jgi:hypothetical protein
MICVNRLVLSMYVNSKLLFVTLFLLFSNIIPRTWFSDTRNLSLSNLIRDRSSQLCQRKGKTIVYICQYIDLDCFEKQTG